MGRFTRAIRAAALFGVALAVGPALAAEGDERGTPRQPPAPQQGYLDAHSDLQEPKTLLGGALNVRIEQDGGVVFVQLPDERELDTHVFGVPGAPRAHGGTPVINGLPPRLREEADGDYTVTTEKTPYGDKHTTMLGDSLTLRAHDETATDAAVTRDSVEMTASWRDQDGNTYTVTCCERMAAHGLEFPTFGGVVTNHLLHGFTRLGTPLMPTQFAHLAFWGMGEVRYNDQPVAKPHLVHGMLTEYVRQQGYKLAQDHQVRPAQDLHFHLMVPPMKALPEKGVYEHEPVPTGFRMPDGKMLPFWHVMFEQLKYTAERGG
ncbi:hypothetical protein SAMN05216241_105125 [Limimonas halophila]|uniref:DUF4412 domain-containing protein n=1 Tax=Limimonas halophila TaxID=1082479 RepID=A0A1G7RGM4_9PROT|nr:hypothetical protein [Limimonas halophila]SDG09901.1 hypothetical protein SAMN05216241_105125 [Limimonas halophila]